MSSHERCYLFVPAPCAWGGKRRQERCEGRVYDCQSQCARQVLEVERQTAERMVGKHLRDF